MAYSKSPATRAVLGSGALLLGSVVATQIFANTHHYHTAIGGPLFHYASFPIYAPWRIWEWVVRWGWGAPLRFRAPMMGFAFTLALLAVPMLRGGGTKEGVARWATLGDLRSKDPADNLAAKAGIVLGWCGRRLLRYLGAAHALTVAPTRSGKTTSTGIPTVMEWPHSLFIHDPKEELYALTAGWRATFSKVIYLNPTDPDSDCFNPLDGVRFGTIHETRDISLIAGLLADPEGEPIEKGAGQHFGELATDFNMGVIAHGLYTRQARTLAQLDEFYRSEPSLDLILAQMRQTYHLSTGCHPLVHRAVDLLANMADRELSGVRSTASRGLRVYIDPLVARMTNRSDFVLQDLRERQSRPMSIYFSVPYNDQERLRPLSRLIVRQILGYCTHRLGNWPHRLLMLIDEVQALKRMPALSEALNYAAGYGVNLSMITPSLHELERLYGEKHNFLEGCHIRVAYAPNDFDIAKKFSNMTGMAEEAKLRESWSSDLHSLFRRHSTSTENREVPLLTPTAFMQLHKDKVLLLSGNNPPALLTKAWYWKHPTWRRRSLIPAP